jgi:hypothetical protein
MAGPQGGQERSGDRTGLLKSILAITDSIRHMPMHCVCWGSASIEVQGAKVVLTVPQDVPTALPWLRWPCYRQHSVRFSAQLLCQLVLWALTLVPVRMYIGTP